MNDFCNIIFKEMQKLNTLFTVIAIIGDGSWIVKCKVSKIKSKIQKHLY